MRNLPRWSIVLAALILIPLLVVYGARTVFAYNLSAAEQRWESGGLVNYRYTLQIRCVCLSLLQKEPLVVEVQNGATVRVRTVSSGEEVPLELIGEKETVPGLFKIIRWTRERNAHKLDVSYDKALGYPTRISIDEDVWSIDDEADYQITDLVEIPAQNTEPLPVATPTAKLPAMLNETVVIRRQTGLL